MPSSSALLGFAAAALVLLLIPGPAVLYIVARSLSQGHRAGFISVLGLATGGLVHVATATAGLSAVLLTSATAFGLVKVLGAGYLMYLGVSTLLARRATLNLAASEPRSSRRLFTDGVLVSVLNPKAALFFLAFLPQFVDPGRGPIPQQVLLLGLLFIALALSTDSAYVLVAGALRRWLGGRIMQSSLPRYVSGGVYLGLGVSALLMGRRQ